jgi:hypothetical protein
LPRFSGHLRMSAAMHMEVFHEQEEKLQTIQPGVQTRGHQTGLCERLDCWF